MTRRAVHISFWILLGFVVVSTVALHVLTGLMTTNAARILGATISQLLVWGIAYGLCLGRPSGVLLGLGVAAVVLARLVGPWAGWAVLLVLIVLRFAMPQRGPAAPGSGTGTLG